MDAKIRVTRSASAVTFHLTLRVPYDDLRAAGQALLRLLTSRKEKERR